MGESTTRTTNGRTALRLAGRRQPLRAILLGMSLLLLRHALAADIIRWDQPDLVKAPLLQETRKLGETGANHRSIRFLANGRAAYYFYYPAAGGAAVGLTGFGERRYNEAAPRLAFDAVAGEVAFAATRNNATGAVQSFVQKGDVEIPEMAVGPVRYLPGSHSIVYVLGPAGGGAHAELAIDATRIRMSTAGPLLAPVVARDGRMIAASVNGPTPAIEVVDTRLRRVTRVIPGAKLPVFCGDTFGAFARADGRLWRVVKGDREWGPYDDVSDIECSPDGVRVAYWAKHTDGWYLTYDGRKTGDKPAPMACPPQPGAKCVPMMSRPAFVTAGQPALAGGSDPELFFSATSPNGRCEVAIDVGVPVYRVRLAGKVMETNGTLVAGSVRFAADSRTLYYGSLVVPAVRPEVREIWWNVLATPQCG